MISPSNSSNHNTNSFTKSINKQIFWLFLTAVSIGFIVAIGGATRLTHSGLSIVEWKPILGIIPPLSHADWMVEFEKYKLFPEYKLAHSHFTLNDFKFIYWMEFLHRLAGRAAGFIFFIPFIYFYLKKLLPAWLIKRSFLILGLGLAQGAMGWYMVKSGLVKEPSVSHFRLSAHLLIALLLFSIIVWSIYDLTSIKNKHYKQLNWAPAPIISYKFLFVLYSLTFLLIFTIFYGALVAGLKAGLIYNTYPLMNGQWIANDWNFLTPLTKNFINNPTTVQFIHRWLAFVTLVGCWYVSLKLFSTQKKWVLPLMITSTVQFLLGVFTLILQVPVWLGTLHQVHVLLLLSALLYTVHRTRNYLFNTTE